MYTVVWVAYSIRQRGNEYHNDVVLTLSTGQRQWTKTVDKDGGQRQWTKTVDKDGGQRRWTKTVDKDSGQRRWTKG